MLKDVPLPATHRLAIRLHPRAERAIRRGHPWVYAEGISQQRHAGSTGDLAVIFDREDRFLAIGLYDPASPIRVRILHQGSPCTIDDSWFRGTIRAAFLKRKQLAEEGTTGYRVVHGENDQLPGLVIDRYGESWVVKLYTAAWVPHLQTILETLEEVIPPERIVLRLGRSAAADPESLYGLTDGMVIVGESTHTGPALFLENQLTFEADLIAGHKTGFFLDQRENRSRVEQLSAGKSVLNVFAYTGAFSVYAARGGAREVTSLDISAPALAVAERNFAHNRHLPGVGAARHEIMCGDAFAALDQLGKEKRQFDLVILDPPAFAKSQGEVERALQSYERLIRQGLGVVRPGGQLIAASCSSRIGEEEFLGVVEGAARRERRVLRSIVQMGHPVDHPVGFAEGRYLKTVYARVA